MKGKLFLVLISASICLFLNGHANAQSNLDATFNAGVTEGKVQVYTTEIQSDGKILVGGGFSIANGVEKNTLVRLNTDGTLDATFNPGGAGPSSVVYDIIVLSDGKILISGNFSTYNGVSKAGVARLNSDGTLDATFNPGGTGLVGTGQTMSLQTDGKILISGSGISAYNGTARFSVLRLNADGSLDTTFTSPFTTPLFVEEVDVQADGKILIGGVFNIGSPARTDLARLNANGTIDTTFNAGGGGTDGNGIYGMTIQPDGKILIGGSFLTYNGVPRQSIARINTDGSLDTSFVFTSSLTVMAVENFAILPDGKIYVAGLFSNGSVLFGLIRLSATGSNDSTVLASVDNLAYHISLQADGKPLLSGFFNRVASQPRNNLVRFNTDGFPDTSFAPSFIGFGYAAAIAQQTDGKTIAAGNFNFANGAARNNVARFNADGTLDTAFNVGTGTSPDLGSAANIVNVVAIQPDGKILVGGIFGGYNGTQRRGIFRLNADGSLDTSFEAVQHYDYISSTVNDILFLPDGSIVIGGFFADSSGSRTVLILNSNGTVDPEFTNTTNGNIQKFLLQPDGKIIAVGNFTTYAGQNRSRILRVNIDGTLDTTFNPGTGANTTINNAALQADGKIIIGGAFVTYNGTTRNRIARLNADGSLDTTFNPGAGTNGNVETVLIQSGGKILIGGRFSTYNGTAMNRLARLNADGSLDTTFVSGFDSDPRFFVRRLLLQPDGKLLVAGLFKAYNGITRNALARLTAATPIRSPFDFDGDSKTDISIFRPSSGEWWINQSSTNVTGALQFGSATDKLAPGDYTGDGKADIAFFRPSTGEWFIIRSEDFSFFAFPFGSTGDTPVPADFDGDGKTDVAVFRASNSTWYIQKSSGGIDILTFGAAGDAPVVADYDGDGRADIAITRINNGNREWWVRRSSDAGIFALAFGSTEDKAVQGDYTGDGKADIAFYRPSNSFWYILRSEDFSFYGFPFGLTGDIPTPGDYDGDGKTDVAVFRPSNAVWYISRSTQGFTAVQFGANGDIPIPSVFVL